MHAGPFQQDLRAAGFGDDLVAERHPPATRLSNSRTLAAGISLGIAGAAFDDAFDDVQQRDASGRKIIDFFKVSSGTSQSALSAWLDFADRHPAVD